MGIDTWQARYVPHQLADGTFAVRDMSDDELLRGYASFKGMRIWRGDHTEAEAVCALFNGGLESRAPLSVTEAIKKSRIIKAAIRKSQPQAMPFVRCACGVMVKTGKDHTCRT